jgi:hypothetical protein
MICHDNVAEISSVPLMLAGITEDDLRDDGPDAAPPDTLLPSLLRAARRERLRRRWVVSGIAGVAAAAIIALSVALAVPGGGGGGSAGDDAKPLAMTALVSSPVHATAAITDVDWGTRISLTCRYQSEYAPRVTYNLVVHGKDGSTASGGSWRLSPDETTHFVGGTSLHRADIASIDITAGSKPILTLTL